MDSKNNINENNNKSDLNIKELLSNNNIFQKDNNNLCNKETEENQKKIEEEKKINTEQSNNIINIDEKKELKEEKKEGINNSANTINKKYKMNAIALNVLENRSPLMTPKKQDKEIDEVLSNTSIEDDTVPDEDFTRDNKQK